MQTHYTYHLVINPENPYFKAIYGNCQPLYLIYVKFSQFYIILSFSI